MGKDQMKVQTWMMYIQESAYRDSLQSITRQLGIYKIDFNADVLKALQTDLGKWKETNKEAKIEFISGGHRHDAIKELSAWLDGELAAVKAGLELAGSKLQGAALCLLDAYGDEMPKYYSTCLVETFVTRDSTKAQRCFKYYSDPERWQARTDSLMRSLPDAQKAQSKINGYTPTLAKSGYSSHRLAGITPPLSRRIEVDSPNPHTLVHEMLHWVCHDTWEKEVKRLYGSMQAPTAEDREKNQFVLEGCTEWLTRKALGGLDKNEGGYGLIMPDVIKTVAAGNPTPGDIVKAYLKGENVQGVGDALLTYRASLKARNVQSLTPQLTPQQAGLINLALEMQVKSPIFKNAGKRNTAYLVPVLRDVDPKLLTARGLNQDWVRSLTSQPKPAPGVP